MLVNWEKYVDTHSSSLILLLTNYQGGMLSLEEQIIDATTEEGQKALKEFEEQERAAAAEHAKLSEKYADDPE